MALSVILSAYVAPPARAVPLSYTITYDSNANQHENGAVSGSLPSSSTHSSGALVTVASNSGNLARQGFTFAGWNTTSNGTGTTYTAGSGTITISSDTTLYAKWEIPSSARLLANSSETSSVVNITNPNSVTNGNSCVSGVRGITSDGTHIYVRPDSALGYICKLTMDGVVVSVFNIGAALSALSGGSLSLTYSKGCIFIQPLPNEDIPPDYVGNSTIRCIDLSDSSITSISLPAQKPLFPGQFWLSGNLIDFPDGRIGAVSKPYLPSQFLVSGADTSTITSCPLSYCKILRLYTLSSTGKNVIPTWSEDMVIAESENWPNDDHGIATDGTYLYQSNYNAGYRVYALRSGSISYRVFNGSGSGACGASTGVSGGMCQINYPVTGNNDAGKVLGNNTYWGRNHTTNQYLNGDYNAGRFWVSGSVAPPAGPGSSAQSITYNNNGGAGTISATTGNTNAAVSLSNGSDFSRTGFTLARWDTATAGNGASFTLGQTGVSMPAGGLTLYAVWSANSLTVTYDSQGGSAIVNGSTNTGGSIASSPGTPTREFHSFRGWFTGASGGSAITFPYTHGQTANFTLYAQWTDTRRTQTISLSGDTLDRGSNTTLSASGFSGTGEVSYSISSGDCTIRGAVLTVNGGSGTCVVNASIAADSTYQGASTSATFTLRTRQSQAITLSQLSSVSVNSTPQAFTATASSGLIVSVSSSTPSVCTISSGTVRAVGRGTCTVVASQGGNASLLPAPSVTQNFTVTGLPQTVTFAEPNSMTTISEDQAISATSSVGLSVNLKSSTPSVCSVSSNAVVPIAAGVCIITASQPGDSTYEPALDVSRNITIIYVAKSPQNITISQLSAMIAGEPSQGLSVTSSTRTRLQITVNPASVCSLDSQKKIIPIAEGQCIVTAAQEETRQYLPAISSVTLSIFKSGVTANRSVALQWIRPAAIDDKTALGVNQLNATASVPGSFVYSPSIGTILPGGIHDLTVTFTPTDRSRFLPTTMTVKILVLRTQTPQSPSPSPSPSFSPENKVMLPQPKTINFVSGSSKLTTFDQSLLRTYADLLKQSGVTEVTVAGFTDNVGRENLKLSTARAKVVKEFLIRIFPTLKVNTQSFGSSNPVASNESDAGKALNRRVTITPIK